MRFGGIAAFHFVTTASENPIQTDSDHHAPFRIKICGVRSDRDVRACAAAGADAIGLNFHPASLRYVDPTSGETAAISEAAARHGICRVGLFVNRPIDQVHAAAGLLDLDAIQFHGDELRSDVIRILDAGFAVVRAIRLPTSPMSAKEIQSHLEPLWDLPITFLFDADAGAAFGGSGKQLHWPSIAAWASRYGEQAAKGWVLAGGLEPNGVAEAITQSTAKSVDVASGVELPRGTKSAELIQRFVLATRLGGVDETCRLSETLPTAKKAPND